MKPLADEKVAEQFLYLSDRLESQGYAHYEISNFAKNDRLARHNTAYWQGHPYLGFGPSAHSFDGLKTRRWNITNNVNYQKHVDSGTPYWTSEILSDTNRYNEYIMTWLAHPMGRK